MDIFESNNYRKFLRFKLQTFPRKGYGQAKKLAEYLDVSTAFASQVLAETKHLNSDQAFLVCEFLSLSEIETGFFLKLLDWEKAGNHLHKKWIQKTLDELKKQSKKILNRVGSAKILSDEEKALFYSDWYYSAIRMYCSVDPQSVESLIELVGFPRRIIADAVQFLLKAGLIVEEKGKFKVGPLSTHIDADSPWVVLHHGNWRKKALDQMKMPGEIKVHYTSPMTLSKRDAEKIQGLLLKLIEDTGRIVDPSPSEELFCMNIDWFKVQSKN